MKISKKAIASSIILAVFSANSGYAAGLSSNLTSTSALANSYAGSAAGVHDASDMFFNAAILSDIEQPQFIASLSHLDLDIDVDDVVVKQGTATGNEISDAGLDAQIPALYFATPINDVVSFGLALTIPYGLGTKYDQSWAGRYNTLENNIESYNFNPNFSFKISDNLSVGAGVQAQYTKTTFTSMSNIGGNDIFTKIHGSDWGHGYNLGLKYKINDDLKFGLGYRSKITHKFNGNIDARGVYNSQAIYVLDTPESLTAGLSYDVNQDLQLAFDTTWTRWSRLKYLRFSFPNVAADSTGTFKWNDSFLYSLGANYNVSNKFLLRTGLAYEKDAVPDSSRNFIVPTGDRIWTSIGFNYKITDDFSIDTAYVHQFYKNVNVRNAVDDQGNVIDARFKNSVNVVSLGIKKNF